MPTYYLHPAPGDYTSLVTTLTFGPGSLEVCVIITIANDPILELVELFRLELTTQDSAVDLDPKEANITIISDDSKWLSVSLALPPTVLSCCVFVC